MQTALKYFLYAVFFLGIVLFVLTRFWVILLFLTVLFLARLIYRKLSLYNSTGKDQEYTIVIDADDTDKEYRVPKFK